MSKQDDVVNCCNEWVIKAINAPDGTIPDPDGTMGADFRFGVGNVAPFLSNVQACLHAKGHTGDISSIFPDKPAFLAAKLALVIAKIDKKVT
jgi:hypothetical protein